MKCSTRLAPFPEGSSWAASGVLYGAILLALLGGVESSCHKRQVLIPPAAPAAAPSTPAEAAQPQPKPKPQEIPPPPTLAPEAPATSSESVIPNPPPAPPPAPAKPPRRPGRQATAPPPPSQPAPAAPAPQLGIVLTADQERQYNAQIDQSLQHAEASLRSIGNHNLSTQQQASLDEARNFIRQAQATRASDLPGARRLAERAEVLAGNLANSLH